MALVSFILGGLAMLAIAVFIPTMFGKMVASIRSLWAKANEEPTVKEDPPVK